MIKRVISLGLCLVMTLSLAACGSGSSSDPIVTSEGLVEAELSEAHSSDEAVEAGIYVEKVEGLRENFIRGVDISSVIAEEESGVVYHNSDGEEADLLSVLAEAGYNYVRVKVWVDPYDEDGNGYGGGNSDIEKCVEIGKRATENGIKLLVNFHYSDFWCDPDGQQAPKAWVDMDIDEKEEAIYEYTQECLAMLLDEGIDVGMVQIGNETNGIFCGEDNWINITTLFNSAIKAVREADEDILVAVHFAEPGRAETQKNYAMILDNFEVDYDVYAVSYYPYWHGTLENLTEILSYIAETYDKLVMVAETSYAYTYEDSDGHSNTVGENSDGQVKNYSATVQGQANSMRDVLEAVVNVGDAGIGVFYWEGAWIAIPEESEDGLSREERWELYGSGWASSYAASYDESGDAAEWYGGCAVENQALFDSDGYPLESLYTWEYCFTGATTEIQIDEVKDAEVTIRLGSEIELPETVTAIYNDRTEEELDVEWSEINENLMQNSGAKSYTVKGTASNGDTVKCTVNMVEANYVEDYSFEDGEEDADWDLTNDFSADDDEHELYILESINDSYSGTYALHWYSRNYVSFVIKQTITGLKSGSYKLSLQSQGGNSENQNLFMFANTAEYGDFDYGDESIASDASNYEYSAEFGVTEWRVFDNPLIEDIEVGDSGEVTIGVYIYSEAEGSKGPWGTVDDFLLNPLDEE